MHTEGALARKACPRQYDAAVPTVQALSFQHCGPRTKAEGSLHGWTMHMRMRRRAFRGVSEANLSAEASVLGEAGTTYFKGIANTRFWGILLGRCLVSEQYG